MSLKILTKCIQCDKNESIMWRRLENGEICNDCYEDNRDNLKNELEPENTEYMFEERKLRKSTRATRFKSKTLPLNNRIIPKGKSRRNIFKKTPHKTPTERATTTTRESFYYKGTYFQIGDIVSMIDTKDNIYYAQIRGLLIDTYCEKSAFLTWLLPTKASPPPNERFDASSYIIGPEDENPRRMSCMTFIMNAPSTYYFDRDNPYPAPLTTMPGIWTEGITRV